MLFLVKSVALHPNEVILQLVFSKSIPVLLYGLESLPLTRSDERSLDFTFNRFIYIHLYSPYNGIHDEIVWNH